MSLALGLAAAARLAAVAAVSNFQSVTGFENEKIALNLLSGHGYSMEHFSGLEPSAFMYPLYSFFLAAHFLVFGHHWAPVEVTQSLIGSLGAVLIFHLGRRLFDRMTGVVAAVIYALYPVYVYWSTQGQALEIEVVLLMALVLCWHKGMDRGGGSWAGISGFLLGLGSLSKTLYLALLPSFIIWTLATGRLRMRRAFYFYAIALSAALLTIAPWTIRNALVFHRFIPVTANSGFNLWLGNNPEATGSLYTKDGRHIASTISPELAARVRSAGDNASRDDIFKQEARRFIRENPGTFLRLIPRRLFALWYFEPYAASRFRLLRSASYLLLLPFALAGMALARGRIREHCIFYLMYATITAIYAAYFGQARFRFVVEWSLILFGAFAVSRLIRMAGIMGPPSGVEPR